MTIPTHHHTHHCWWNFTQARWTCRPHVAPHRAPSAASTPVDAGPRTVATIREERVAQPATIEQLLGC